MGCWPGLAAAHTTKAEASGSLGVQAHRGLYSQFQASKATWSDSVLHSTLPPQKNKEKAVDKRGKIWGICPPQSL